MGYRESYDRSISDPEGYWAEQASAIDWFTPPKQVLVPSEGEDGEPIPRWFGGGVLNTCYNALDRHVIAGRADQPALIYHSAMTDARRTYTYAELLERVAKLAGALTALGVRRGDRVVIYMPMIPEAAMAMLACARLGAIHSVVFGGFAPAELAARIDGAEPKVIISASCGLEPNRVVEYQPILDAALSRTEHQPDHCIVLQRPEARAELTEGRDHDFAELMSAKDIEPAAAVEVEALDPLYILYTSGTTGKPKGIVRDNGGHAVAMSYAMREIYDVGAGEVMFTASDVGWVVGHSFIVYGPLIAGATTILYEGKPVGTPDAAAFWRVVAEHGVKAMFTAPTAIRAIRKVDPDGELLADHDLSTLQTLFLAGERTDPDTLNWAAEKLDIPVVDNWWQTETGWPIAANLRGMEPMPIKAGSPSVPVPGYDVQVLGPDGTELPAGTEGAIAIKLPLPPGTLAGVWGDRQRMVGSYLSAYPGYYATGDGGVIDEDGYVTILGRTDDVINVAGHRLSTGAMEAVIATHPAVAECAVIGVADQLKGQIPRGFVVLKQGKEVDPAELEAALVKLVRDEIGAVAALRRIDVVDGLPKTRSGKILRKTMREIADGKQAVIPSTIEDPSVVEQLRPVLGS
ncbi:propionyl-CoA synthetase [Naumannella halotolerans]|uniref:Propionyl-CoA synthetase n=1 Tax=Naumannella halotolerans TaxID=993414 RepID=A0A4R7IYP5_9ACTN|nr:propionyl-CoA synthetase [Naumannella halotolerans]TDT29902.1 propionyl-CoA synthetase [Naumannella halotolerans]